MIGNPIAPMHELSLLENVRDILEDEARKQSFSLVKKVTLEIGSLSCIEAEALRFGFDVVMQGSIAEDAELAIEMLQAQGICRDCGATVLMDSRNLLCPSCNSLTVVLQCGDTMKIKDLLVI